MTVPLGKMHRSPQKKNKWFCHTTGLPQLYWDWEGHQAQRELPLFMRYFLSHSPHQGTHWDSQLELALPWTSRVPASHKYHAHKFSSLTTQAPSISGLSKALRNSKDQLDPMAQESFLTRHPPGIWFISLTPSLTHPWAFPELSLCVRGWDLRLLHRAPSPSDGKCKPHLHDISCRSLKEPFIS